MKQIIVKNIRIPVTSPEGEAFALARKRLAPLLSRRDIRSASVYKRSVDARREGRLTFVYSVLLETDAEPDAQALAELDAVLNGESALPDAEGEEPLSARPVIVGFGPAGMFAGLLLAERGYRPLILERGGDVEERVARVERFYRTGILDTETNIQFGAGGAGTFSDGKLLTRINDAKCRYVLECFRAFGAPAEILTEAKPHIGTDRLRAVVAGFRDRIRALGGEIRFETKMTGFRTDSRGIRSVLAGDDELPCGALILAIGHSARDTYAMLQKSGVLLTPKPFSVGVRIEHLQKDIDEALYGRFAGFPGLGHAEYALSRRVGEDAVYTFCMCPGGEVVAAASEEGRVVTNGMSRYKRDGANANAAIAVSVSEPEPIAFQRMLEERAFAAGGGGYAAPVQTVGDFLAGRHGTEPGRIIPTYMNGNVRAADFGALFPPRITELLRLGLNDFDRKIRGFACPDAVLTGVETRTSAPVRIVRQPEVLTSALYPNLYPCGEGAGYAGGITSAAVDGLSCALSLMRRYRRQDG